MTAAAQNTKLAIENRYERLIGLFPFLQSAKEGKPIAKTMLIT